MDVVATEVEAVSETRRLLETVHPMMLNTPAMGWRLAVFGHKVAVPVANLSCDLLCDR